MHVQSRLAVRLKGFRNHHRPQIAAANADVDDVCNRFTRIAGPRASADSFRKLSHVSEIGVYVRHHVLAVHHNRPVGTVAKGDVQHGAIFGDVDLLPIEHFLRPARYISLFSQLEQQSQGIFGDAVFRKIQQNVVAIAEKTSQIGRRPARTGRAFAAAR